MSQDDKGIKTKSITDHYKLKVLPRVPKAVLEDMIKLRAAATYAPSDAENAWHQLADDLALRDARIRFVWFTQGVANTLDVSHTRLLDEFAIYYDSL